MRIERNALLNRAIREVELAAKRMGRKLTASIENRNSPVPQLLVFDEYMAFGPILMFMFSDDGFIPIASFGNRLPMELQRPFGLRKLFPFITSLPKQPEDEFTPIEYSDVINSLRGFWVRRETF